MSKHRVIEEYKGYFICHASQKGSVHSSAVGMRTFMTLGVSKTDVGRYIKTFNYKAHHISFRKDAINKCKAHIDSLTNAT